MGRGQVGASVIIGQNDKGRDKVLVGGGLLCEHSSSAAWWGWRWSAKVMEESAAWVDLDKSGCKGSDNGRKAMWRPMTEGSQACSESCWYFKMTKKEGESGWVEEDVPDKEEYGVLARRLTFYAAHYRKALKESHSWMRWSSLGRLTLGIRTSHWGPVWNEKWDLLFKAKKKLCCQRY